MSTCGLQPHSCLHILAPHMNKYIQMCTTHTQILCSYRDIYVHTPPCPHLFLSASDHGTSVYTGQLPALFSAVRYGHHFCLGQMLVEELTSVPCLLWSQQPVLFFSSSTLVLWKESLRNSPVLTSNMSWKRCIAEATYLEAFCDKPILHCSALLILSPVCLR